jgi:hypothetical protein
MLSCSNILYIDRPIYINSHRFHACSYQNSLHFKKWKISHFFKNFKFIETKQNKNWVESLYPSLFIYWSYFVAIHSAILSLLLLREEIFIWCAAVVDVCCFIEQETSRLRWQQSTAFVASENDLNVVVGLFFLFDRLRKWFQWVSSLLYYHMPDVAVIRPLILLIYFLFFLYFSWWTDCVFFPTVCLVDHSNRNEGSDECTFVF